MKIDINSKPAFKGAARAGAAVKDVASGVLAEIPKGKEFSSKKLSSFLQYVNSTISSPEQRLIMGVTALFSQPFIDLNNERVSEETRLMSFARTLSKIVVGTTVGVLVRKEAIRLAHKYTKLIPVPNVHNAGSWAKPAPEHSILSPPYVRNYTEDYYKNYVNALGSVMGIGVSLVTNFLIDAPLTQLMTNRCYGLLKEDDGKQTTSHSNLLEDVLNKKNSQNVSFGNAAVKLVENMDAKYSGFEGVKHWFWKRFAPDPSGMLMHTAAVGWAASSAAQIAGMLCNDKIDSNKKKFLIPQEFADAVGNIALYYAITASVKTGVEKLFEDGKIRIKSVMDSIQNEGAKKGITIEKLFNNKNVKVSEGLKQLPKSKALYLAHKNGASILATLAASVLSCNILTPYFRNFYGAYCQEKLKERSSKLNAKIFDINIHNDKFKEKSEHKDVFKKFLV